MLHESVHEWLLWRSGGMSRYAAKLDMPYIVMVGYEHLVGRIGRYIPAALQNDRIAELTAEVQAILTPQT